MNPVAFLFPFASAAAMIASIVSGVAMWRSDDNAAYAAGIVAEEAARTTADASAGAAAGASGIASADALSPRRGREAGASPREHAVNRSRDGMFYVDALVNGVTVRFLVDTGATHVVLTAADAHRIGARPSPARGGRLTTAGGKVTMGWAQLDSLRLAGSEAHGLRAAVAGSGLPVSLLGQDMLARLSSVRIEADRLVLAS